MRKPRFSIVIPTLNEEKFVPRLLSSIEKQTVKDFDVIVVDGKSKDKTLTVVRSFGRKINNLTVVTCEKPGVSRQRNMGARLGKADWLIFIDADSELLPHFIERISEHINTHKTRFFTTWFKADVDDAYHAIGSFIMNIGVEAGILIGKPWAPGPLTIVDRRGFDLVGGYNEQVTYGEDHELGVMINKKGIPFDVCREVLYVYNFRRFRKESTLKILDRTIRSTLYIIFTSRGLRKMPGFVSGGSLYKHGTKKKKSKILSKKFQQDIKQFIRELVE